MIQKKNDLATLVMQLKEDPGKGHAEVIEELQKALITDD